jgi:hypothetical protein
MLGPQQRKKKEERRKKEKFANIFMTHLVRFRDHKGNIAVGKFESFQGTDGQKRQYGCRAIYLT